MAAPAHPSRSVRRREYRHHPPRPMVWRAVDLSGRLSHMALLSTGLPLADRYLLIEQLGSGGMAMVWRGFDDLLGRPVAVKVLNAEIAADPAFRAAIYREARSAARLSHPNITQVYDYGETDLPDGEMVSYVVMELLDGYTLHERLSRGPLPWPEAVQVAAQVASALAAAHRRGIVHRDIAPANVMLTATGAKVMDFGIAALAGGRGDADGEMMGTPPYVAPERLDDAPAAPAADVYALGAMLYESLTGEPPLSAKTWPALVEAYRRGTVVPPLTITGLPPEVVDVCARCLAHDPALRPGSAEIAQVLAAAAPPAPQSSAAGTAPAPPAPQTQPTTGTAGSTEATARLGGTARGRRRKRVSLAAGAALLTMVVVLATAWVVGRHDSEAPSATPGSGQTPVTPADPGAPGGGSGTAHESAPAPSAGSESAAAKPSTGASTKATAVETLDKLIGQIQTGAQTGRIREDVAVDLENYASNLRRDIAQGTSVNLPDQVAELRRKIMDRAHEQGTEPAMDPDYANVLLATVDTLAVT